MTIVTLPHICSFFKGEAQILQGAKEGGRFITHFSPKDGQADLLDEGTSLVKSQLTLLYQGRAGLSLYSRAFSELGNALREFSPRLYSASLRLYCLGPQLYSSWTQM